MTLTLIIAFAVFVFLFALALVFSNWPRWLKAANVKNISAQEPEFGFYGQALQAAVDGVGVAMGIRPYIDDDLAAGRLIAPFKKSVPKGLRWYLIYRETRRGEEEFDEDALDAEIEGGELDDSDLDEKK